MSDSMSLTDSRHSTTLQEQLTDLNTECDALRSQVQMLQKEIEIHKSERTQLHETNEELRNRNKSLQEKNSQLTHQLDSYLDINGRLEEINTINLNLKHDVNECRRASKLFENENISLKQQLEQYQLKQEEIDRETQQNQLMTKYKQRDMEQNLQIEQLTEHIQALEQQMHSMRLAQQLTDDEKATQPSEPSEAYLPHMMSTKTIHIQSKVPRSPESNATAAFFLMDRDSEVNAVGPSTPYPTRMERAQSTRSVGTALTTASGVTSGVHMYNHQTGVYSGVPFARINSLYSDDENVPYDILASLGGPQSMVQDKSYVSVASNVSAVTAGGTYYMHGYPNTPLHYMAHHPGAGQSGSTPNQSGSQVHYPYHNNSQNSSQQFGLMMQQKEAEYQERFLKQKQENEREIQELIVMNDEKIRELKNEMEELQAKSSLQRMGYENKMEELKKTHNDELVKKINEYENRIKVIRKDFNHNEYTKKYKQILMQYQKMKAENKQLKKRLDSAWEFCTGPSLWFKRES